MKWLDAQRQIAALWLGRLEALLARHWPELTRLLPASSATVLRPLAHYGSPAVLAADQVAAERLKRWGKKFLSAEKVERVLASAATTRGVRLGEVERRRLQEYAQQASAAQRAIRRSQRQLRTLAQGQAVLQAQGQVVGVPTACVLWASLGDPRQYHRGPDRMLRRNLPWSQFGGRVQGDTLKEAGSSYRNASVTDRSEETTNRTHKVHKEQGRGSATPASRLPPPGGSWPATALVRVVFRRGLASSKELPLK